MRRSDNKYVIGNFGGFPLRLSWLPRLVGRYAPKKGKVPANLEVIACDLGVGKNMAKSMRAWARAAGCVRADGTITDTARHLFHFDPYLERGESVALLHWLIASNMHQFSVGTWTFNFLRDGAFTAGDAVSQFQNYLSNENAPYSEGTLRGDVEPILRMYATNNERLSAGSDDRFFLQLRLLSAKRKNACNIYQRIWTDNPVHVSDKLLVFAVLQTLTHRETASASLSDLFASGNGRAAPGIVFGFSRDGFFSVAERIEKQRGGPISLATMPGNDTLLTARGKWGKSCATGNTNTLHKWFWGSLGRDH